MNMHVTQNITKYLQTLHDEYKKKCKQISDECNTSLMKIKDIVSLIQANQTNNMDSSELEAMKLMVSIKPFLVALYEKDKVNAYVFEAIHIIISGRTADDNIIINLVTLLQKHLNTNKEQGVKIIQIIHLFLEYKCVAGEVIANIFYTCMTMLDCKNIILVNTVKVICKQIVQVISFRFKNAYKKYEEDGLTTEEYKIYHNDCKVVLNDIYEYLQTYTDKEDNFLFSLDLVEQILKNQEIFALKDVREIFVKIINTTLINKTNTRSAIVEDKINKITFMVIKSKAFLQESCNLILKSEGVLHLFDHDLLKFVIDNEDNKNAYFEVLRKMISNDEANRKHILSAIYHLVAYTKQKKEEIDGIEDSEIQQAEHCEVFDFTLKLFIEYLKRFKAENDEFETLNDVFLYFQPQITHLNQNFENLLRSILFHSDRFVLEIAKYFVSMKSDLKYEWAILLNYDTNNYKELQDYLLKVISTFTTSEIFYLLNAIQNKETQKGIYKSALKSTVDIIPLLLTLFNSLYSDMDEFTAIISDVVDNTNICDENLQVIFRVILLRMHNKNICDIQQFVKGCDYVFEHKNFKKDNSKDDFSVTPEAKQKLIIAVYNYIRISNEKIYSSWKVILNILIEACNDEYVSDDVFNTCQVIIENFYPLLYDDERRKVNQVLCTICNVNNDNLNLVLQSLNALNHVSKHIRDEKYSFTDFRDTLLSIKGIILQNRSGFSDIFETGFEIICNMLTTDDTLSKYDKEEFFSLAFTSILPEIISKGKEIFESKFSTSADTVFEEKKRYKVILQMIINRTNDICKLYKTENENMTIFLDSYLHTINEIICFCDEDNERGFDTWKNDIALDCISAFDYASKDQIECIRFTIQNIPIACSIKNINSSKEDIHLDSLYYQIEVYTKLVSVFDNHPNARLPIDVFPRLFEIKDSCFRDKLFQLLCKSKSFEIIEFYTTWLKHDDNDIVLRVLGAIQKYFGAIPVVNQFEKNGSLTEMLDQSLTVSVVSKHEEIIFTTEIDDSRSGKIIDLLKTLVVLANETDTFWIKSLSCIIEIISKYKEDKDIIDSLVKLTQYLCQKETTTSDYNVSTFHGATSDVIKSKKNSINERIREKILINYVDVYTQAIIFHLYKYDNNDSEKDQFALSSFAFIYDLSYVKPGNYREKLSNRCLSLLFKYSRFVKTLLIARLKQSMIDYTREINIFKNLYPRCK